MSELTGCVALITGAGRGLGAATARVLAQAGATVAAADVRLPLVTDLARDLAAQGARVEPLAIDVRDAARAQAAIEQVCARHGRIDLLVNNAGTDVTKSVEELSIDEWDEVIGVNLRGPFLLSKMVFPIMRRQGGGQILNVVSTAALRAWANAAAYHASKWGLRGLTHALHVEGRPHNIRVTALICGGMRTPFLLDRFPDLDPDVLQDPVNVAKAIRFAVSQPAGTVVPELLVLPTGETSWP